MKPQSTGMFPWWLSLSTCSPLRSFLFLSARNTPTSPLRILRSRPYRFLFSASAHLERSWCTRKHHQQACKPDRIFARIIYLYRKNGAMEMFQENLNVSYLGGLSVVKLAQRPGLLMLAYASFGYLQNGPFVSVHLREHVEEPGSRVE